MSTILTALEAAFGPATYGPPCPYANEDDSNPYVVFRMGYRGEDTAEVRASLIEHLIADIRGRRKGGSLILRTEPSFGAFDDTVTASARLTFTGGIAGTGSDEGQEPAYVN
jgi:hypothetical protein